MLLMNIILLAIGVWAAWTGLKACEQVYGIALIVTGVILAIWSLSLAPLWFQIFVEFLVISLSQFLAKSYSTRSIRPTDCDRC
ncbi:MAG TPA: hypothetical protein DDZ80_21960 [Cyanobacteria bacterium UBA8803]|nr:hypothetical protein [Cyanobacteria bacterium UBA9273]HBL60997.1 hypothetical protein [Cyanobacteria bacterium UBA8803]